MGQLDQLDRCSPLEENNGKMVNRCCNSLLCNQFQEWYSNKIQKQMVSLKLSIWIIKFYYYIHFMSEVVING